jgi:hypothetical protein
MSGLLVAECGCKGWEGIELFMGSRLAGGAFSEAGVHGFSVPAVGSCVGILLTFCCKLLIANKLKSCFYDFNSL